MVQPSCGATQLLPALHIVHAAFYACGLACSLCRLQGGASLVPAAVVGWCCNPVTSRSLLYGQVSNCICLALGQGRPGKGIRPLNPMHR
jgi:hypothetical protein